MWFTHCEACGQRTEHGNRLCDRCFYEAEGRPGDCPNCGGAPERAGAPCASCAALIETGTAHLM